MVKYHLVLYLHLLCILDISNFTITKETDITDMFKYSPQIPQDINKKFSLSSEYDIKIKLK